MPIRVNPGLTSALAGVKARIVAALSQAVVKSVDNFFEETLRPELDWGEDHILVHEIVMFGDQLVDTITIYVPHLRNRPVENAKLANETIPGIFQRAASSILNSIQNAANAFISSGGL